jgi:uncharacterized protein (TIGR03437 family)
MKSFQFVLGLLAASAATAQQYTISTVAGTGLVQGYFGDGAAATGAQLDFPLRVAVDSTNNFYIADYLTWVVRKVTAAGIISTIAGDGTFGFQGDNGPGFQAKLTDVHGLAVDAGGSVFFADTTNSRVRQVTATGLISTFAGDGTRGYAGDGDFAYKAKLTLPAGITVDSAGNVYIADYGNSTVRKVDSKGKISTFAGTGVWGFSGDGGPAGKAALAAPFALATDPAGNIYISDLGNSNIRKVTPDGNIQTVVSNIDAESIAVDAAGSIYYPNYVNSTVQKIRADGGQFTIAGNGIAGFAGDNGPATNASLNQPYGVAVDSAGNVYVADSGNHVIRLLTPVSSSLTIANAASGLGGTISPGEIVVLYGTGLGPATLVSNQPGSNGFYGTQVAGTTVSFNGTNAPMIYTSATQVAAIVPYSILAGGSADVTVTYQGQTTTTAGVPVTSAAPGVFTTNAAGSGQAAAVNQNKSINSVDSPAPLGSIISLYVTGEGQTSPAGVDGKPAAIPLPQPLLPVSVTMSGQPATVTYQGGAPTLVAGLMQVNVRIPQNLVQTFAAGPVQIPVVVQVGSIPSQTNVTIAVSSQ